MSKRILKSRTVIVKSNLDAVQDGLDLGNYTEGWHDEWSFPHRTEKCDPHFTSNMPEFGIGNNMYDNGDHFLKHMVQMIGAVAIRGSRNPIKKCDSIAFASYTYDGKPEEGEAQPVEITIWEYWNEDE